MRIVELPHRAIKLRDLESSAAYDLLTAIFQPRLVIAVGTWTPDHVASFAPYSFLALGGFSPASLVFSCTNREDGGQKDSLLNIERNHQFSINFACGSLDSPVCAASESPLLAVPLWRASPIACECLLHEVVRHGSGPYAANYVVAEIVAVLVKEDLMQGEALDEDSIPVELRGPRHRSKIATVGELFSTPGSNESGKTSS